MIAYLRRTLTFAAIAMAIFLTVDAVMWALGKVSFSNTTMASLAGMLLETGGGALMTGAFLSLAVTAENLWDNAWGGKGPLALPRIVRFSTTRAIGYLYLLMGVACAIDILIILSNELVTGFGTGSWHTVSVCEYNSPPNYNICGDKMPKFLLWIFHVPIVLWYAIFGYFFIRQGLYRVIEDVK